jgi:hypothetical protein
MHEESFELELKQRLAEEITILRIEGTLFCFDPREARRRDGMITRTPPWCTDRRDGRTAPQPRPGSRDADGLRASELEHPVQDVDADGDLGRPARVGA